MRAPNWFDNLHSRAMENATADEVMAIIGQDKRIRGAVQSAIENHKRDVEQKIMGPSRTQMIRDAIAEVLTEV